MSTTVVGLRPTSSHRHFTRGGLAQVAYSSSSSSTGLNNSSSVSNSTSSLLSSAATNSHHRQHSSTSSGVFDPSLLIVNRSDQGLLAVTHNSSVGCSSASTVNSIRPFYLSHRASIGDVANASSNHHSHNQSGSGEKSLGHGAFGVVWSATDPRDGRKLALKRIPRVFHNPITAKRVHRELKMLSTLEHDNIVTLVDVVKTESFLNFDECYFLFELMQTDLHKIIVSPQSLSIDHVKIFVYQILRGLKYLHSARIIHRDIKPGNMLVNSNCLLKICDFGLARMDDPFGEAHLTHEVVTQYYRSPELLMEASRYSYAVDLWSVGCTFAELMGRRILFPARSPLEQLDLILNITGTPSPDDLEDCHPDACCFVLSGPSRPPSNSMLYSLAPDAPYSAIELLRQLLTFNPRHRITASKAVAHPFLEEARLRYHSCMCTCCHDAPQVEKTPSYSSSTASINQSSRSHDVDPEDEEEGVMCDGECEDDPETSASSFYSPTSPPSSANGRYHPLGRRRSVRGRTSVSSGSSSGVSSSSSSPVNSNSGQSSRRQYCNDFDPVCCPTLPLDLDTGFRRLSDAKRTLWEAIRDYHRRDTRPNRLVLNRNGLNYSTFMTANVAQAKEVPASHRWR